MLVQAFMYRRDSQPRGARVGLMVGTRRVRGLERIIFHNYRSWMHAILGFSGRVGQQSCQKNVVDLQA